MSKQVRLRRGTTVQHASFTGADGEVTYDTTLKCLRVHDGSTPGGTPVRPINSVGNAGDTQTVPTALTIDGNAGGFGLTVSHDAQVLGILGVVTAFQCLGLGNFYGEASFGSAFNRNLGSPSAYAASLAFNVSTGNCWSITLAGNLSITLSGMAAGRRGTIYLLGDGSIRTLTFPAAWRFLGSAAPGSIAASKAGLLEVVCLGPADADVRARWFVEP
jgi:hypothetical protein